MENSITVYHGGGSAVESPGIKIEPFSRDFGWGFYCTTEYSQAKLWACRHKERHAVPTVTAYTCRIPEVLRVKQFPKITEEWLVFVADCRRGTQHAYDIVLGPMVDDALWVHMENFLDGSISRDAFLALAKDKKPVHQISFHSARALTCMTQVFRHAPNGGMDDPTFLDGLLPAVFKTATTE